MEKIDWDKFQLIDKKEDDQKKKSEKIDWNSYNLGQEEDATAPKTLEEALAEVRRIKEAALEEVRKKIAQIDKRRKTQ